MPSREELIIPGQPTYFAPYHEIGLFGCQNEPSHCIPVWTDDNLQFQLKWNDGWKGEAANLDPDIETTIDSGGVWFNDATTGIVPWINESCADCPPPGSGATGKSQSQILYQQMSNATFPDNTTFRVCIDICTIDEGCELVFGVGLVEKANPANVIYTPVNSANTAGETCFWMTFRYDETLYDPRIYVAMGNCGESAGTCVNLIGMYRTTSGIEIQPANDCGEDGTTLATIYPVGGTDLNTPGQSTASIMTYNWRPTDEGITGCYRLYHPDLGCTPCYKVEDDIECTLLLAAYGTTQAYGIDWSLLDFYGLHVRVYRGQLLPGGSEDLETIIYQASNYQNQQPYVEAEETYEVRLMAQPHWVHDFIKTIFRRAEQQFIIPQNTHAATNFSEQDILRVQCKLEGYVPEYGNNQLANISFNVVDKTGLPRRANFTSKITS